MEPLNLDDVHRLARERLDPMAYDYFASGAGDELTLGENQAAFRRRRVHYHVLAGVAQRDLRTTVLGTEIAFPVLVAPTAFQALAHPDGELATARAASTAGTIMCLSTLSTTALEDVVAASSHAVWFQLYVYRDRELTRGLVERAERAGCTALVLTVDAPLLGRRERDVRNRFRLPDGIRMANVAAAGLDVMPADAAGSGLASYFGSLLEPGLGWDVVAWLREITALPIVLKGLVRPDDARRAADAGAAAVIVSNHGGRQLDTAPATLDVLEPIAQAVGDDAEILLDGGIRRGTDVVKALALGARAVLVGRPVLWGLAVDGEPGVGAVLDLLRDELDLAFALCGCRHVRDVTRDLVD